MTTLNGIKKPLFISILCLILLPASVAKGWSLSKSAHHPNYEQLQTGDIVFQDTSSKQEEAVTAATGSNFTHIGVVLEKDGRLYLFKPSSLFNSSPSRHGRFARRSFTPDDSKTPKP